MPDASTWPIEAYLAARLADAVTRAGIDPPDGFRVELEVPRDETHGDWASTAALTLAKRARRPPRAVAEELVRAIEVDAGLLDAIELAGPGFINFRLSTGWLQRNLARIHDDPDRYGCSESGAGERILVEYVSANPTGPLNVVSARAASFGDALVRLLDAAGYRADGEFYVNDWGRQAELFGASIRTRFAERVGVDAPPIPEDGYEGDYIRDLAGDVDSREGRAWMELPEQDQRMRFARYGLDRIVAAQRDELDRFRVTMTRWFRESALHQVDDVSTALKRLTERGHVFEQDGATWFRSTAFGDQKDRVLVRSNGEPTYLLADTAYHESKFARGYERLIDVWGPDHHSHVQRMMGSIEALGRSADRFEVILLQWVNLLRDGVVVKMSKRAGDFVTLGELVGEVGVDAARFFFLLRRAESPLDFDLSLAVRRSEENPVYYVQYAHARIWHVLEYARRQAAPQPSHREANLELLCEPETVALLRGLSGFPSLVAAAARTREPHRIPIYLKDLASRFHSFYHQHRVVTPDTALTRARLVLTAATGVVVRRGLSLIGVSAPEAM